MMSRPKISMLVITVMLTCPFAHAFSNCCSESLHAELPTSNNCCQCHCEGHSSPDDSLPSSSAPLPDHSNCPDGKDCICTGALALSVYRSLETKLEICDLQGNITYVVLTFNVRPPDSGPATSRHLLEFGHNPHAAIGSFLL